MRISDWSSDVCSSDLRKFRRASAGSRRNSMILSPMRYSNLQQVAWTRPRHDAPEEEVGLLSAARKLCTCFAAARESFGRCLPSVGRYRPPLPDLAFDLLCFRQRGIHSPGPLCPGKWRFAEASQHEE